MRKPALLRLFAALLLPLLLAPAPALPAEATDPLGRTLSLNLWGAGLSDFAVAVKRATGVDIVFFLPDLPENENTDDLYLVTGEVPLAAALETLARRYGFRFRVAEAGRVELSRGYGWVSSEASLRFVRMDCLSAARCAPEDMEAFLRELLKPLPLLAGDFSVRVERYPLPERPDALRAAAVLPPVLGDYFVKSVECLSGAAGDFPGEGAGGRFFVRAREYDPDWEPLLTRPVRSPRGDSLRELLADVAGQAGVAIALREPPAEGAEPSLSPDVFQYTLGRLCETLSEEFGLGKRVFLVPGGVVFERGETGAEALPEMDGRGRELFWSGLAVAGFDVGGAAARPGGVEALLNRARREVFPGVWRDPACSIMYSPVTGRVAVTAPYNVVERMAALFGGS